MHVWTIFLDAALGCSTITLVSSCVTLTSIHLAGDSGHGSPFGKVPHSSLGFMIFPQPEMPLFHEIICP